MALKRDSFLCTVRSASSGAARQQPMCQGHVGDRKVLEAWEPQVTAASGLWLGLFKTDPTKQDRWGPSPEISSGKSEPSQPVCASEESTPVRLQLVKLSHPQDSVSSGSVRFEHSWMGRRRHSVVLLEVRQRFVGGSSLLSLCAPGTEVHLSPSPQASHSAFQHGTAL